MIDGVIKSDYMELFERMQMNNIEITVNELKNKIRRLERRVQELEATTYPKKMTKENIEEELGYKIDIIEYESDYMDKYKDMTKGELLIELEKILIESERLKKEKDNIEHVNNRLNYKLNVVKETIKNMVDRL